MHFPRHCYAVAALAGLCSPACGSAFDWVARTDAFRGALNQLPIFNDATRETFSSSYLNSVTKKFAVNGTGIPLVDFDVGESYAGLLPVSDDPKETRKLFFW